MDFKFPNTTNKSTWELYLDRKLTDDELDILDDCKDEMKMNIALDSLRANCNLMGYYIPYHTEMDGKCLFESLVYLGIGEDIKQLKYMITYILYIFGDYRGFLPNSDASLKEMFSNTNEIKYVKCIKSNNHLDDSGNVVSNEGKFLKYTYNVMCQDISNANCWNRLPTQLILSVLSYVFKLVIVIHNDNNEYVHTINESGKSDLECKEIHLGHLKKCHYVPLEKIPNDYDESYNKLYYNEAYEEFIKFGKMCEENKSLNT